MELSYLNKTRSLIPFIFSFLVTLFNTDDTTALCTDSFLFSTTEFTWIDGLHLLQYTSSKNGFAYKKKKKKKINQLTPPDLLAMSSICG